MRWLGRRQRQVADPSPYVDRATRQFQELAAEWQVEEPTQQLAVEPPLMTLAAQWRTCGGCR